MQVNPAIMSLIKEFLYIDRKSRQGLEAVILCGSYATGRATEHSDIDLCYIGDFPDFKREVVIYKSQEFQLMIAPWSWYEEVITDYERKEDNGGTITAMLAQGQCVYGNSEKLECLSTLAKKYFTLGPSAVSDRIIFRIRIQITGLFDNYIDQPVNTLNQKWLAYNTIQCCIESQFKLKSWWTVKPKYELDELNMKDPVMAKLVEACISTGGSDRELVMNLCTYVLKPVGGFLREAMFISEEQKS